MYTYTVTLSDSLVKIKFHEHGLMKSPTVEDALEQPLRGEVEGMSRKSRKRLLDLFASLDRDYLASAIFVTLTYGQQWPSPAQAKVHLDSFQKRLSRAYPDLAAIWRMEFQKRGAPHFHLLVLGVGYIDKDDLQRMWGEVIGPEHNDQKTGRFAFTRVEKMRSSNGAVYYMAKYVAKSGDGFNYRPYLTASQDEEAPEQPARHGRTWGVRGRSNLVYAEVVSVRLMIGAASAARAALMETLSLDDDQVAGFAFSRYVRTDDLEAVKGILAAFADEDVDLSSQEWRG